MVDGPGYLLRAATESDKESLRALHKRCYRDVVISQFGKWDDEQQRGFFDVKWNPANYQIIVVGGTDVGAIAVAEQGDHVFLSEIQIDPDFQNRGIGSKLVEDVVDRARSAARHVRLEVLHANRAQELYVRLGFKEIDRTDTHVRMER